MKLWGNRAKHRASTIARSIRRFFRRTGVAGTLAAALALSTITSIAIPTVAFAVSAPTSIRYDSSFDGFKVSGIALTASPSFVQVGITVQDQSGNQVDASDPFNIDVGYQCSPDPTWYNPGLGGGEVTFSGDNTTNLIISGAASDVQAALSRVWLYRNDSSYCAHEPATSLSSDSALTRTLKITAVESQPGLMWSPSTGHYYKLATQTTNDGLGRPKNSDGQVTDWSRWFVKWTTARAEAKETSITIGGHTHRGYLAAITTKDEFQFLNNNVSGGSGTIYPAWVGGTDQGHEGTWKWVDGPEAAKFGGDSSVGSRVPVSGSINEQDYVAAATDSNGLTYYQRSDGSWFYADDYDQTYDQSSSWNLLEARDSSGSVLTDLYGHSLLIDPYRFNGKNCWDTTTWDAVVDDNLIGFNTPGGSVVDCSSFLTPALLSNGTYYSTATDVWPLLDGQGIDTYFDESGYVRQVEPSELFSPLTVYDPTFPNYEGATFWGPDSTNFNEGSMCERRGARGICSVTQTDSNNISQTNDYYVYWSNGNNTHQAAWDGVHETAGDGIYSPQPDNAAQLSFNSEGENALIINWCARNNWISNTNAVQETLYGNYGYYCTPGWNDLPAGKWANSRTGQDSPNNIGTTDYVIEYCGYSDESSCAAPAVQAVTVSLSVATTTCPVGGNPDLSVSFAAPGVMYSDLTSDSKKTEDFNGFSLGWNPNVTTAVGKFSGELAIGSDGKYGGSGSTTNGSGKYAATGEGVTFTPSVNQEYVGFYWSAGNATNYVQLLDDSDNTVACFDASDLVAALGGTAAYIGNPNSDYHGDQPNELFAYVHMRLPTGFAKVLFYGGGFEFDNVSISETVPFASQTETLLFGPPPTDPPSITQHIPTEVPVDPRASQVALPQLALSGASAATVCYRQVADSAGTPLPGAPTVNFQTVGSPPVAIAGPYFSIYGSLSQTQTNTGSVLVVKTDASRLTASGNIYIEVASLPTSTLPTEANCADAVTRGVFTIKPFGLMEILRRAIVMNR